LIDEVPDGQTPQTVSLYLYDELVDVAKAGDRCVLLFAREKLRF
jgi:DNA replication licensing factor MCM4